MPSGIVALRDFDFIVLRFLILGSYLLIVSTLFISTYILAELSTHCSAYFK
jgi:hypothetical protein